MFGYVRVCKPELLVREYEEYKAVYCTLCKTLGKEYGVSARMLLNYDAVFYILLRECALSAQTPCLQKGRCPFNPLKSCRYVQNSGESYAAAAALTVLMSYHKALDTVADGKGVKKCLAVLSKPYLHGKYKKAKARYPFFADCIEKAMQAQSALEQAACTSTDRAADPSAAALREIFGHGIADEEVRRITERIGYCVGRFVYLLDAYDDLQADLENGTYNPFVQAFSVQTPADLENAELHRYVLRSLHMSSNEAAVSFALLDGAVHRGVLENILCDGLETALQAVHSRYQEEKAV